MISDSYNVRSWLTGIGGSLFSEVIRHEDGTAPRWDGNISETSWRNPGETSDRGYVYRYDGLSRLTAAEYADASGSGLFTEGYGYDLNGNMTSRAKAVQLTDSSGNTTLANLVARNSYTGKELATETGLYDFCARYLETSMGRFTTIDPLAEKYPSVSPYAYCAGDPVNRVDPEGRDPQRRILSARELIGKPYSQDSGELRTGLSKDALSSMDCSEFVNRVLFADKITDTVLSQNTAEMVSFFGDEALFIKDVTPQDGDIALWKGHVGIVSEVGENDTVKIIHARGWNKLSFENPYCIPVNKYVDAEFIGYFRPREESSTIYSSESEIDPLFIIGEKKVLPILNIYAEEQK